jgi:hypothetical protein
VTRHDIARFLGVKEWELDSAPERSIAEGLNIMKARAAASAHLSKKAGFLIPPDFFMGL